MDIQQLFRDRLPHCPYCTNKYCANGLGSDSLIRAQATALRYRYIQTNAPEETSWLVFDLNDADAGLAWERANLPEPTIIVTNPANTHAHLFYGLKEPVCTSRNARHRPQSYLVAVRDVMRIKLKANRKYVSLMSMNPFHRRRNTKWGSNLYNLHELGQYVTLPQLPPWPKSGSSGSENGSQLFNLLRRWAYKHKRVFEREGCDFGQWEGYVLNQAEVINNNTFIHKPLSDSEVKLIAQCVAEWVWDNFSAEGFSAWQSKRGRLGNLCKTHRAACICGLGRSALLQILAIAPLLLRFTAAHPIPIRSARFPLGFCRGSLGGRPKTTTKHGEPWKMIDVSRSTWYQRRKESRLPVDSNVAPCSG